MTSGVSGRDYSAPAAVGGAGNASKRPAPAGLGKRIAAWLIDTVICFVPAVLAYGVSIYVTFRADLYFEDASPVELLLRGSEFAAEYPRQYMGVWSATLAIWIFTSLLINLIGGHRGQTPGRKAVGIQLQDAATGSALGAGYAFARAAFFYVVPLVWFISVVLILIDSENRRGLHDRATGARVTVGADDPVQERIAQVVAADAFPQHDTQVFHSPLMRGMNSPEPQSGPPVPLPGWLDRAAAPVPPPAPRDPRASDSPDSPDSPASPALPPPAPRDPWALDSAEDPSPNPEARHRPIPPPPQSPAPPGAKHVDPDPALAPEVEMTRLVSAGKARRGHQPNSPEIGARIRLSDGQLVDIRGTTLVGRNPAPRPQEHAVTLLSVQDPNRSVSKTHLIFDIDARGLWLADRTSTNGTVVTLADGQQIVCMPERQVRVGPGARIQIGDVTITVLPV